MSHFTNHTHQPSPEEIQLALGSLYPLWEMLTQFIDTHDQIAGEWSTWGPVKGGWGLRYRRKGKALVALYPQKEMIIAQVVLGKAQAERALSLKLGKKVSKMLREAPQLRDGRWLSIPILNEADVEDVERLLLVKMRPIKRTEQDRYMLGLVNGQSKFMEAVTDDLQTTFWSHRACKHTHPFWRVCLE